MSAHNEQVNAGIDMLCALINDFDLARERVRGLRLSSDLKSCARTRIELYGREKAYDTSILMLRRAISMLERQLEPEGPKQVSET